MLEVHVVLIIPRGQVDTHDRGQCEQETVGIACKYGDNKKLIHTCGQEHIHITYGLLVKYTHTYTHYSFGLAYPGNMHFVEPYYPQCSISMVSTWTLSHFKKINIRNTKYSGIDTV